MTHRPSRTSGPAGTARQRGVVLLFSLIALVVLLIGAVALMKSFNTSMFMAGNIAFKRDLQNQGERAVDSVLTEFRTGALSTVAARSAALASSNYSATTLSTNAQGIPDALALGDTAFAAAWTAPDITTGNQGVRVRYVVDRMCSIDGDENTLGSDNCLLANNSMAKGRSASNLQAADGQSLGSGLKSAVQQTVVYRLSIRVDGPRSTQAFFQSTFTVPSS